MSVGNCQGCDNHASLKPQGGSMLCPSCKDEAESADRIATLETELSACRRVVEAIGPMRKAFADWLEWDYCECDGTYHVCGITQRRRELEAVDQALAALESPASALPKEEKPACPTCGGEGQISDGSIADPTPIDCPACTPTPGGHP